MNLTETELPNKPIEYEQVEISEDLQRYKEFLAEQTKELKTKSDSKLKEIMDFEITKQQLFEVIQNIIFHNKRGDAEDIVPSKEELSKLILAFHQKETRMKITESLKSIT
jgi:hypothetical protein